MDGGVWGTTVHGVSKESDTAEQLTLPQETLTLQIPEFGKLSFTR